MPKYYLVDFSQDFWQVLLRLNKIARKVSQKKKSLCVEFKILAPSLNQKIK